MKPKEMTHTIRVEAIVYIPGEPGEVYGTQGQRPRVALIFWLHYERRSVPCYHEMPASQARKLGLVVPGWNSGRNGWFLRGQTIECRVSYYGESKAFAFNHGPLVKLADGTFSSARQASYHHAKITRYGTITGGERQTDAHLEAAFAMGVDHATGYDAGFSDGLDDGMGK